MEISIETNFEDQVEMNSYFQLSKGMLRKNYTNLGISAFVLFLMFYITLRKESEHHISIFFAIMFVYYIIIIITIKYNTKRNLIKYLKSNRGSSLNYTTNYTFSEKTMNSKNDEMETIVPYSSFHYLTFRKESIYLTLNNGIIYILKWKNSIEKNDLIEVLEQISDKHQIIIYRKDN
ncbi:MAG: hypothetical protein ACK479_01650 [Fluviicola sp.]